MNTSFYMLVFVAALLYTRKTHAQLLRADPSAFATGATTHQYTAATAARLFTGTEYLNYTPANTEGNQFFMSNSAQFGSLAYDDRYFARVPLLYDLKLDRLILLDSARNRKIQLLNEHVTSFTLSGQSFVRLVPDLALNLPAGFYRVLLAGRTQLLARHSKRVVEELVQQRLVFRYKETEQLFVHKNKQFSEVTTLKTLLNALPDQKTELQKYARNNKLRFTAETREASAKLLVEYYHTLVP